MENFIKSKDHRQGRQGVFCKKGEFNRDYDSQSRFTPDPGHFAWMEFVKQKHSNGEISIYRNNEDGMNLYLVLKGREEGFLKVYPEGCTLKS